MLIFLKMKSRAEGEATEYCGKTTNFGVIFGFNLRSAIYKQYDLGQVIFLNFSVFIYKIKTEICLGGLL